MIMSCFVCITLTSHLTDPVNFAEELLCLHRGQGMELLWRDSLTCPTEEEYIAMVNDSTSQFHVLTPLGTEICAHE